MGRYVPKTYNNRRWLRIIFRTVLFATVAFVAIFVALFFWLETYFVTYEDGTQRLEIPWLMDELDEPEEPEGAEEPDTPDEPDN